MAVFPAHGAKEVGGRQNRAVFAASALLFSFLVTFQHNKQFINDCSRGKRVNIEILYLNSSKLIVNDCKNSVKSRGGGRIGFCQEDFV